jgi:hypothetical protein
MQFFLKYATRHNLPRLTCWLGSEENLAKLRVGQPVSGVRVEQHTPEHMSRQLQGLKAQWLLYVPPGLTFTNSTFCPHSVFMCFVWISEQTAIISLYIINWLAFITETECVYCAVRIESLTIPSKAQWLLYVPPGLTVTNSTFCPHSVFVCFVWISEHTAISSLYSINLLVFITETECLLRGKDWIFNYPL